MISSRFSVFSSARMPWPAFLVVGVIERDYPSDMAAKRKPLGAILAGGRASRLGGEKANAHLHGRPLITWPLEAMQAVLDEVVVVAKRATKLPALGVPVWIEPDAPSHPAVGIVHALERGGGRPIGVCAADLPLVDEEVVRRIATAPGEAVVARAGGRTQPLLARYEPGALRPLRALLPDGSMTGAVAAVEIDVPEAALLNVNTPAELERAAQGIARR